MMLAEKTFDTGEVVINYVEGSVSGSPMLLLHGLTAPGWQQWRDIIPRLSPTWQVVATDFRGHNKSGRAVQYRVVDYARDTIAFLRGRFDEPAVVMGHSLGALTATAVAAQAPDVVRAAVLLDPPFHLRNNSIKADVNAFNWFSWVRDTLKTCATYEDMLTRCRLMTPGGDENASRALADQIGKHDIGIVECVLQDQLLDGISLESALRSITCPALLMRGDWDHHAALDDEDAAFVRANLKQVVDVKIAEGNHMFPMEQTDLTMEHVNRFLAGV
jgi:pimeloyl-ACP methyl ester carboxylesterase